MRGFAMGHLASFCSVEHCQELALLQQTHVMLALFEDLHIQRFGYKYSRIEVVCFAVVHISWICAPNLFAGLKR